MTNICVFKTSNRLLRADVTQLRQSECREKFNLAATYSLDFRVNIVESQFCAQNIETNSDTCLGNIPIILF